MKSSMNKDIDSIFNMKSMYYRQIEIARHKLTLPLLSACKLIIETDRTGNNEKYLRRFTNIPTVTGNKEKYLRQFTNIPIVK